MAMSCAWPNAMAAKGNTLLNDAGLAGQSSGDAHSDQGLAAEQAQQSLEFEAVAWGGVELEGHPALIMSISQAIESSRRRFGVLYASESVEAAFAETFGRQLMATTAPAAVKCLSRLELQDGRPATA